MHRIRDSDTCTPPANLIPVSHGQHHEQELSKTFPNEEHFPDAPPTPLPPPKVQACLILAVGSELKAAPASHLVNQQSLGKPETSHGGAGEQQIQQARGKMLQITVPLQTKNRSISLLFLTSITQGSLFSTLGLAVPALLRTQIHLL